MPWGFALLYGSAVKTPRGKSTPTEFNSLSFDGFMSKLQAGNLMRCFLLFFFFFNYTLVAISQKELKGVVADSVSHKALPFATIKAGDKHVSITGINGQFSFSISPAVKLVEVSYISYNSRKIAVSSLHDNDTIFLSPAVFTLGEVIVKPQTNKIKRIINAAVRNKPLHNPEMYDLYQCNMYYKMKADLLPSGIAIKDSSGIFFKNKPAAKKNNSDTTAAGDNGESILGGNNHLVFSETYSKRFYKRPQQLQEIVIASRFSGLRKTYFTNLVTDVLPFHVYNDYISLNGKDYINPVSKGWQQRYDFFLADEITGETDTTFIFTFKPKRNTGFNALRGMVYINSDGYAISHFISSTGDTASDREVRIEQVYDRINGRWFPRELNYDLIFKQYITPAFRLEINGHSVIDSVSFTPGNDFKIEKAYPVRLGDSVDLYREQEWKKWRKDTITTKEQNTYRIMDSVFKEKKIENILAGAGKLVVGRLPYKKLDIDIQRLIAFNDYEDMRVGIGLFTNEKISKYYEAGGWVGYGIKDKRTKYGFSLTGFAKGNKDNRLKIFYNDDYQNAGNIHIHPEVDREGYRTWLLIAPDRVREYGATAHMQKGYWEIELDARKKKLSSLYENNFVFQGKNYKDFDVQEAGIGLRYAYGEKRAPAFGYYFPVITKYPVVYFRSAFGTAKAGNNYSIKYVRALIAVDFRKHLNRWGNDMYRLEGGFIHPLNNDPLSRSFLLASKGFRRSGLNYYAWGGFLTMHPYDYYSDNYVSFLYKHDFDKYLWQLKYSKPFVSIIHNLVYGTISDESKAATANIIAPVSGYHESGILLNQLIQKNFLHTVYIYLNVGALYHWTSSFDWNRNGVFVIGISGGF